MPQSSGLRVAPMLLAIAIVGITAATTLFVRHLPWLTSRTSDEHGGVWLLRPVVAPGDDVELEVVAFGGRRAGIHSIDVSGPGTRFSAQGRGNDWGSLLETRPSSRGEATEFVRFTLSKDVGSSSSSPRSSSPGSEPGGYGARRRPRRSPGACS